MTEYTFTTTVELEIRCRKLEWDLAEARSQTAAALDRLDDMRETASNWHELYHDLLASMTGDQDTEPEE